MEPSLVAAEDQKFCPLQYDDDHVSNNSPFVVLIYGAKNRLAFEPTTKINLGTLREEDQSIGTGQDTMRAGNN
jgi:hypothetical protein